jgi:hypothetical protein
MLPRSMQRASIRRRPLVRIENGKMSMAGLLQPKLISMDQLA